MIHWWRAGPVQETVVSRSTLPTGESAGVPSSNMEKRETVTAQVRRFDKLESPRLAPGFKGWATAEDVVVILAENTRVDSNRKLGSCACE